MSRLLVLLQFAFISAIAFPSSPLSPRPAYLGLFIAGLVVFVLAIWAMRLKNFAFVPEPKAGSELVTGGIYGYVRHPMYLAVLLCAVAASLAYGVAWKWLLTALLALLLGVKWQREERLLLQRFEQYAAYRERTRAIVPLPW
jgi:protein-S-isoprenylcysteine O-methyltransferase Ste14